jgi:hypothetical protein
LLYRLIAFIFCCLPLPALSGYFNCSVIYDEFESLMNKQFLTNPDTFVSTVNQRLSKTEYETLQKGQFLLYEERADMGIAVFRTDENLSGKLLFRWSDPLVDGQSHLVIEHVVILSRVEDGYGPRRMGPFRIKPGFGLDLDTGLYDTRIGQTPETEAGKVTVDVRHGIDPESGEGIIEAANDAQLHFPLESMCSAISQ